MLGYVPQNLLSRYLTGTHHQLGSEATEATMKLGRQYYMEVGQPQRVNFIAREHSYHGTTLGALSMSGHVGRRSLYIPLLSDYIHRVSACNSYRQRLMGETNVAFVNRKAAELDQKFRDLGPNTVIGFMCEPISGATLGCVPYVPGYLAAMKAVCTKYGALFILDEIMCGMGRSGTLHTWQAEHSDEPGHDCVPDLQTLGKGLGGGYEPVAAVLIGYKIVNALKSGSGSFLHGQTYQAHPTTAAAALAVLRIIKRENLLENVRKQGAYLSSLLYRKLDSHPYVGDIRGMGLFWAIEFVKDKKSKEPFDLKLNIAKRIHETAVSNKWSMSVYPCQGTADGISGDHIIIAPAYNITSGDVELIATTIEGVIEEVFDTLAKETADQQNGYARNGV
jgi:adenosylmethionine-8-amino-7-oxononanoate aminotransferase